MVKEDFSARFGKILVNNWVRMVEAHANEIENTSDDIIKLYGTTISVGVVINNHLFLGRIGDGSIFNITSENKKLTVNNFFEDDDANSNQLGLGTASLCSRDAHRKWQTQLITLDEIKMVIMATDGFVDSLKEPRKEIIDFFLYMIKKGVVNFEQFIDEKLKYISDKGVGDDISLVIFLPDLQGKV
jgi:serine/threonine protein phosphatase PrpC